jgi:hypothetical protein
MTTNHRKSVSTQGTIPEIEKEAALDHVQVSAVADIAEDGKVARAKISRRKSTAD